MPVQVVGGPETAAPCIFLFAFIRVFRELDFSCGGVALRNPSFGSFNPRNSQEKNPKIILTRFCAFS
jgi:hypothetical protein